MKKLFAFITLFTLTAHADKISLEQQAPNFTGIALLPNGTIQNIQLKDYFGKRVILYFYPMDNSPGCTKKAQQFRDDINELKKHNTVVIGVSCDSIKSHKKFQEQYNLPYTLVSDSRLHRTISKMYNAAGFFYSQRKTFLIDEQGKIIKIFTTQNIVDQIQEILKTITKK